MTTIRILALVSIGAFCLADAMPAHARGSGGGGHNSNSGSHAAPQNHPAVSAAKAKKGKQGKVTFNPFSITRKIDRASPMQ